jgi:hypothetical protein
MAISKLTFSPTEFQFAVKPESTVGTKNTTTMQRVNVDDIVSVSSEVVQTLDPRSGEGRTLKTADVHTSDQGGMLTTISMSGVFDDTIAPLFLSNALGIAVGSSPASFDMAYNYAPVTVGHGDVSSITTSMTVAFVSPIDAKTRIYLGCVISSLEVTWDGATEGGRGRFSATIETRYRPVEDQPTPTSMSAYGATYSYLREFGTTKTIGGSDVVLNKLGYTIENPVTYAGFQADGDGDPETMQRAIPSANIKIMAGVKFDANTEGLWNDRRDGTTLAVVFSNNATWASATFGIKADYCKLDSEVSPSGTDAGVFQDLSLVATASTSGDIIQIVP